MLLITIATHIIPRFKSAAVRAMAIKKMLSENIQISDSQASEVFF